MKSLKRVFSGLAVAAFVLQGCTSFMLKGPEEKPQANGRIAFAIDGVPQEHYSDGTFLKSGINTDTNSFILKIYSTAGEKVYEGAYGQRPMEISVTPGGYEVGLYSRNFTPPALDAPVFGEEHTIVVAENEQARVSFKCTQVNAGIRLQFEESFKEKFPGSGVALVQGEKRLEYGYSQTKYAYVSAEPFSIVYGTGGKDTLLLEKSLEAGQMVTMRLSHSSSRTTASVFKVEVDTTRAWSTMNFNAGLKIPTGALTIAEAKGHIGEKNIKVFGYLFGGDPSTTTVRVGPPFESRATIVIAPSMTERNRNNMMVVELPSGEVRDALNLVNNPDNLGRPVVVTGTIVQSYYGYPGIKSTKSYTLL